MEYNFGDEVLNVLAQFLKENIKRKLSHKHHQSKQGNNCGKGNYSGTCIMTLQRETTLVLLPHTLIYIYVN